MGVILNYVRYISYFQMNQQSDLVEEKTQKLIDMSGNVCRVRYLQNGVSHESETLSYYLVGSYIFMCV